MDSEQVFPLIMSCINKYTVNKSHEILTTISFSDCNGAVVTLIKLD